MSKIKRIFEALLIFVTGVLFLYFSYPFFNSLLTALDDLEGTDAAFEGWSSINILVWAGYYCIVLLWLVAWPAYLIFTEEQPAGA